MLTGKDLKTARRKAGVNQTDFGRSIGLSRHTVSYWENKRQIKIAPVGPTGTVARMLQALSLPNFCTSNARVREWGFIDHQQEAFDRQFEKKRAALKQREAVRASKRRVVCGAKTRKGHPCKLMSEPGRRRCKFHGGKSTGPKTAEGRARIAECQRRRWADWHACKA